MASLRQHFLHSPRPWRLHWHLKRANYYVKSTPKRGPSGQAWLALAGVTTALTGTGIFLLGRPEDEIIGLETEGPDLIRDGGVVKAYLYRAWDKITKFKKRFSDPSSEKLLPDFLPHPYQRPYTLLLEINDLLIHTSYDRQNGWKYQKRPGVDALLMQLLDWYEIVIFTSENGLSWSPLVDAMDPKGLVLYKLYRDSTKYIDGHHVKDLTHLNRPLSRVIIIDNDRKSVKFQPENSIVLDKWTGEIGDTTLLDLIPFLQTIAVNEVDDVRPVLDFYKQQGGEEKVVETFKVNQARLRAEEERLIAERDQAAKQTAHGQRKVGSSISPFSFHSYSRSQAGEVTPPLDTPLTTPTNSNSPDTLAQSDTVDNPQSWVGWISSWIGWK